MNDDRKTRKRSHEIAEACRQIRASIPQIHNWADFERLQKQADIEQWDKRQALNHTLALIYNRAYNDGYVRYVQQYDSNGGRSAWAHMYAICCAESIVFDNHPTT